MAPLTVVTQTVGTHMVATHTVAPQAGDSQPWAPTAQRSLARREPLAIAERARGRR